MKKDKPTTDEDKSESESDTQEMATLFSSDNTELTDFTQRVKRAIRGEKPEQEKKPASFKNNVVNLFRQK